MARDNEKWKARKREWYYRNKEKVKSRNRKNYRANKQFLIEYKESYPCLDCEIKYPYYVMDIDHRPDEEKTGVINQLRTWSLDRIKEEIAKCDLVCSNCHRIRTHARKAQLDEQQSSNLSGEGSSPSAGTQVRRNNSVNDPSTRVVRSEQTSCPSGQLVKW